MWVTVCVQLEMQITGIIICVIAFIVRVCVRACVSGIGLGRDSTYSLAPFQLNTCLTHTPV